MCRPLSSVTTNSEVLLYIYESFHPSDLACRTPCFFFYSTPQMAGSRTHNIREHEAYSIKVRSNFS